MNSLPQHISYSAFTTWLECGWKYKLTRVDQVQTEHAVWFTGGSAVHKATEIYDLEPDKFATLEELWNHAWFEQVQEDEKYHGDMGNWQYAKREDMSWWYGEGLWMVERWLHFRGRGWTPYKDFIEKPIELPIGDTILRGAVDRVMTDFEGKLVLLDIKTGASAQKSAMQLATYSWALDRLYDVKVDKVGFWDARTGHVSLWGIDNYSHEKLDSIYSTFDKARKHDIFIPNMSNCSRCEVLSYCTYMNGKLAKEKTNGTDAISSK